MNWLQKISSRKFASLEGEWWIMDGYSQYADGDIGGTGHDGYVMEHVFSSVFGDPDDSDSEVDWMALVDNQWTPEQAAKIEAEFPGYTTYKGMPKDYAVEHLGWIRVLGANFEVQKVDNNSLDEIVGHAIEESSNPDVELCISEQSTGAHLCFMLSELSEAVNQGLGEVKFRQRQRVESRGQWY